MNVRRKKIPLFPSSSATRRRWKVTNRLTAGRLNLLGYFLCVPSAWELWLLWRLKYANTDAAARNKKSVYDDKMRGGRNLKNAEEKNKLSTCQDSINASVVMRRRGGGGGATELRSLLHVSEQTWWTERGSAGVRVGQLQAVEGV